HEHGGRDHGTPHQPSLDEDVGRFARPDGSIHRAHRSWADLGHVGLPSGRRRRVHVRSATVPPDVTLVPVLPGAGRLYARPRGCVLPFARTRLPTGQYGLVMPAAVVVEHAI